MNIFCKALRTAPLDSLSGNSFSYLLFQTFKRRVLFLCLRPGKNTRRQVGSTRLGMHLHTDPLLPDQRKQLAERFRTVDRTEKTCLILGLPLRRHISDRLEHFRFQSFERRIGVADNVFWCQAPGRKIGCAGLRMHWQGNALPLNQCEKLTECGAFLNRPNQFITTFFSVTTGVRHVRITHSITSRCITSDLFILLLY